MSVILRDYQIEAIDVLWRELYQHSTGLCVLPTGCGKTEVMMALLKRAIDAKPDLKVVVLVNKIQLLDQTYRRFIKYLGVMSIGVFCGSRGKYRTDYNITIATIQSIHQIKFDTLNLIILDEVHNVDESQGRYFDFIEKHRALHSKLKILAFTATPFRATGRIYGPGRLFERVSYRKHLPEMIQKGYLVQPRMKHVNNQFDVSQLRTRMGEFAAEDIERLTADEAKVNAQIEDALPRMFDRKKIVWACSSIDHCEMVARILKNVGEAAVPLHSKLDNEERLRNIKDFEVGRARHMIFVSIVSEGYDYPPIDCIVLMRPMRSPVLYVQTVGRGLRPTPEKKDLLVLDYGKVVETVGPLDNPIIPEPRNRNKKNEVVVQWKFCPQCLEYVQKHLPRCHCCNYEFVNPNNSIAKLDPRASENGKLLSEKPEPVKYPIRNVALSEHVSKNGNECLRVDYIVDDILGRVISEYFVFNNTWAYTRLMSRLVDLGITAKADLKEQVQQKPTRIPASIHVLEEKYPKVTRLNYESSHSS